MKKLIITFTMLIGMIICFSQTNAKASQITGVEINENTFPDNYIRNYMKLHVDTSGDEILQQEEINKVEYINFDYETEDTSHYLYSNKINCKGLEIFKNVKRFRVNPLSDESSNVYNIDVIYEMPKLEELYIVHCHQDEIEFDFSKFSNLKELMLVDISNIKKIDLSKNIKLTNMDIGRVSGEAIIDLRNLRNLRSFSGDTINIKGLKFGKLKKITKLRLGSISGENNIKIKTLDISELVNIKSLELYNFTNLKTLKIGKLNKLKEVNLYRCKKLKKINLSKCRNIKKVSITYSGLNKLTLRKNNKIKDLYLGGNNLKTISLTGKNIKRLELYDNNLKKIDITKLKKLKKVYVDRKTKIVMTKKQQKKVKIFKWKNGKFVK